MKKQRYYSLVEEQFHGILISVTPKYFGTFSMWSIKSCSGWKNKWKTTRDLCPSRPHYCKQARFPQTLPHYKMCTWKRYLCWTDVSYSDNKEWLDWYFPKPTNAFTHYEHSTTNTDIQDDEISVPLRFDEEDLKRTKFDRWLSYMGIVN